MLVRSCAALVMALCAASMALAQAENVRQPAAPREGQARQQAQPQGQIRRDARPSGEISHQEVAAWLILGNEAEIALGHLALEKSQNDAVRDFAQQMVKDHTAFSAKLKKFIPGAVSAKPQAGIARPDADASRPRPSAAEQAVAKQQHSGMLEMGREAAQLELAMTKQLLGKYEGQDFDMGYLGQQMGAHIKMMACLTAAQDVGPQEFQTTIAEGLVTTREHMQHAEQLAAKLENKEYGEGQRRENAPPDLRQGGERRDGGARPAIRALDADAPRQGDSQQGTPRGGGQKRDEGQTDGPPDSARDREGITP